MNKARALETKESLALLNKLKSLRDRCYWVLGSKSGFRTSELLSLKVSQVYQFGDVVSSVMVASSNMKGKNGGREIPLHEDARKAIREYLKENPMNPNDYLFKSRKGENQPISRVQAYRIIKDAANSLGLQGTVSNHSMRKSFAKRVHKLLGNDLQATQKALGHKNIGSTTSYLEVDLDRVKKAILKV